MTILQKTKNAIKAVSFSQNIENGEEFLAKRLGYSCYVWVFLFKDTSYHNYNTNE